MTLVSTCHGAEVYEEVCMDCDGDGDGYHGLCPSCDGEGRQEICSYCAAPLSPHEIQEGS